MVLGAVGVAVAGCSVVRLAYNQAPDALYWWLDGYFQFTEVQSLRVREDLTRLQHWHRRHELPAYVELLRQARQAAAGPVDAERVCALADQVRSRLLAVADRLAPTVIALAPGFSNSQLQHLEEQLTERNRKWTEEWLDGTPQERLASRVKKARNRAEQFYGRLDDAQRATLESAVQRAAFDAEANHRETLRRQREALETLRQVQGQPAGSEVVARRMHTLFARAVESPDAAYRATFARWMRASCDMVASLHNQTRAEQRQRAAATLLGYEDDARALMAR